MPHARKQEQDVAGRKLALSGRLGFEQPFAASDIKDLKLGQDAATLPGELVQVRVYAAGIAASGWDARGARPGNVEIPLHVPLR